MSKSFNEVELNNVLLTPDIVLKKLVSLKCSKSAGPDKIHPRVLRELANELCTPLSLIFNLSLTETVLPHIWKAANITAIHKKGSRKDPGNYRPISLTSVVVKIMESVLRDAIVNHMTMNKLFSEAQHGFVPGRSCATQLLSQLEDWTNYLDDGNPVDIVYLDFRKAFDSVPHVRLINKEASYGVNGLLLRWIQTFLSQRVQRVTVDDCFSEWTDVISGIPKGSVLGPTLFVMFVNDLPEVTTCHAQLYADDAKVYSSIQSQISCQQLQCDLDNISAWSSKWQLPLNSQKCKTL